MTHLVPTGGKTVFYSDVEAFVEAGIYTPEQMANFLNADFRHHNDCNIAQLFNVLADVVGVIGKNLGLDQNPAVDSQQWRGLFDDEHRNLPTTGNRGPLMRSAWSKALRRELNDRNFNLPVSSTPDPPATEQPSDVYARAAYVMTEWNELCQTLTDHNDYAGDLLDLPEGLPRHQAVNDAFKMLTGGRRFGAVTGEIVQQVIDDENLETTRTRLTNTYNDQYREYVEPVLRSDDPEEVTDAAMIHALEQMAATWPTG